MPKKKNYLMNRELIEWGSHIAHKPLRLANKSKREFYPMLGQYLLGRREKLNCIDIQYSTKHMLLAMYIITCILKNGGSFLIINTNQIFDELIEVLHSNNNDAINISWKSSLKTYSAATQKAEKQNFEDVEFKNEFPSLKNTSNSVVKTVLQKKTTLSSFEKNIINKSINKCLVRGDVSRINSSVRDNLIDVSNKTLCNKLKCFSGVVKTSVNGMSPNSISFAKKKSKAKNGIAFTQYKWIGGSLSNWGQISKTVWRIVRFSEEFETFLKTYNINFPRYHELKKSLKGLVEHQNTNTHLCFRKKPDLILLANSNENLSIVREANSLRIPVMALADSNTNLSGISYPIPVNNESIHFFFRFLDVIKKINKNYD